LKSKVWIYFILLQPFLDVATNFILKNFDFPITVGVVVRMVFMVVSFLFVMTYFKRQNEKKMMLLNLAALAYLALNFIVNFIWKDNFSFMAEAEFLAKTAYPLQLFLVFYVVLKNNWLKKEKIVQLLTINLLVISLFIILPTLLNLSFVSYNENYDGNIGWFNAANEIGAMVAFLLPLVIWGLYTKKTNWLGVLAIMGGSYAAYLIGTKVSLGSVLVTLSLAGIYILVKNRFRVEKTFICIVIPLILLVISFGQAPAVKNIENVNEDLEAREERFENRASIYDAEQVAKLEEIERLKELSHPIFTKVLSSRDLFVIQHYEFFRDAEPMRIAFGMGYAAENDENEKITEMDFFDFFFSFGIVGLLLAIAAAAKPVFRMLQAAWSQIRYNRNNGFLYSLLLSLLLIMGISFIAGHVIFAPGVSIYLAIGLAMLFVLAENKSEKTID
jgi:hypothetical protein